MIIFNIHGRKTQISASSQIPIAEKKVFVHFYVIFLNV